jgi:hypothetical protein
MYYRDVLLTKNTLKKTTSYVVDTRLVEVTPVFQGYGFRDKIEYSSIRDFLNIKTLREIAKNQTYPVEVSEEEDYLTWKCADKKKVYISKRDWKLYAEGNSEKYQFQAYYVLRALAKFGYVVDYKRVQKRRRENPDERRAQGST